ncbi:hypothetical protein VTJ83DRAFT_3368 [Remersonia thermophila]|uniref:Ubiquitin-like domain-containing protein n=1 Tax=Remersonia thermophila TaxID=72144 RepID=A0ABR4DDX1_9PEZI
MAEDRPSSAPPGSQNDDAPLSVNLQIISPSAGVGNLRFPDLPATTTLQQLKHRIRESVASRPADEHQRLIHRGRMLARDTDTLLDIFGEEAIRSNEQQTIHLVVRDAGDHPPPPSEPAQRPDASASARNPPLSHPLPPRAASAAAGAATTAIWPGTTPLALPQLPQLTTLPPHIQHQILQQQHLLHHQQQMMHRVQQQEVHRHMQMLAQQQNQRAAAQQGPLDGSNNAPGGQPADPAGGRNSPVGQTYRTVTREGVGPDGQRYSIRFTVNEAIASPAPQPRPAAPGSTSDPVGQRPLSAADVRNIMHGADATRAAQTIANAMQRNASGGHPANMAADLAQFNFNTPIQPIQPGVTTPIFPGLSRNASRAGTPDIPWRSVSHGSNAGHGSQPQQQQPSQGQPEVYLLSSPTGPRAVLIHGAADIYTSYTTITNRPPAHRPLVPSSTYPDPYRVEVHFGQAAASTATTQTPLQSQPQPQPQPQQQQQQQNVYRPPSPFVPQQPLPQIRNEPQPAIRRRPVGAPIAPAVVPPAQQELGAAPRLNHPGNPGVAPLVAAAWPHIWLMVRLAAFAWWFSYTNPSWERWLSLAVAFLVVLAINTGIFNGIVENAFHPVREQLEGMLPLADRDREQRHQQQQQQGQQGQPQNHQAGEPDPAQLAARLVAQRRMQNGGWLLDQLRQIERAGILFLASFAPGVAERHIRQIEERERAERRAAEQARATAAAEAAAAATAAAAADIAETQQAAGEQARDEGEQLEQQPRAQAQPEMQAQPRLIDV